MAGLLTATRVAVETGDIFFRLNRVTQRPLHPNETAMRAISIANQTFILIANLGEFLAAMRGGANSSFKNWKTAECVGRFLNLFIRPVEVYEIEGKSGVEGFENGILLPFASFFRALNEGEIYQQKAYLDLSVEELAKVRIPVYEGSGEHCYISSYRNITKEECEEVLQQIQSADLTFKAVELGLQLGAVEKIAGRTASACELAQRLYLSLAQKLQTLSQTQGAQRPAGGNSNPFDLLALSEIPQELEHDVIFSRYVCPITLRPIRHPVADPNGVTLYEEASIREWIAAHGRSPVTGLSLGQDQLLSRPALQLLINNRLQYHSNRIEEAVAHHLNIPPPGELQAGAEAENPNY